MNGRNRGEARAGHRSALAIAALELAAAGHPLIPLHTPGENGRCSCGHKCDRPGKHPRGTLGLRSASCDLAQVEAWWYAQPTANIGQRCDGMTVFDIDGPAGERSLEQLQEDLGELPPTSEQETGRGLQRFYSIPDEARIGNSTAPLGNPPELDLRAGAKAYVVTAPSRHTSGKLYAWTDPETPIAALPAAWIRKLEQPLPAAARPEPLPLELVGQTRTTPYGRAALRDELRSLAGAEPGGRNNALNRSAYKLAGWVAAGELDWYELRERATDAGLAIGLSPFEVERTVSSAMNAGFARPRRRSR
jgi:hypothetical protein